MTAAQELFESACDFCENWASCKGTNEGELEETFACEHCCWLHHEDGFCCALEGRK